jgi:antitoxin component of RelBE/YafQ-DinJ toxin-antitoxin module
LVRALVTPIRRVIEAVEIPFDSKSEGRWSKPLRDGQCEHGAQFLVFTNDTYYVRTYNVFMNLTLSVDDDVVQRARRHAEAVGKSVNQLVREFLEQLAGNPDRAALVEEFRELSKNPLGDSKGWKFNRDEIHERR